MVEPLKFQNNGKPLLNGEQTAPFPNFLTSNQFVKLTEYETRLKIFSGTANPLLSHVSNCTFLSDISIQFEMWRIVMFLTYFTIEKNN